MNTITELSERTIVREQVKYIISQRMRPDFPRRLKQRMLIRQSLIFENFLYKVASSMDEYSDLTTLEARLLQAAEAILLARRAQQRDAQVAHGRPSSRLPVEPFAGVFT